MYDYDAAIRSAGAAYQAATEAYPKNPTAGGFLVIGTLLSALYPLASSEMLYTLSPDMDPEKAGLGLLVAKAAYNQLASHFTFAVLDTSCSLAGLYQPPHAKIVRLALTTISTFVSIESGLSIQNLFKENPLSKFFYGESLAGPPLSMITYLFLTRSFIQQLDNPHLQQPLTTRLFNQLSSVVTSSLTSGLLHTLTTVKALNLFESYTKEPESTSNEHGSLSKSKEQSSKASSASTLFAKSAVVGLSSFLSSLFISYAAKHAGETALYASIGGVSISTLINLVLLSKEGDPLALGAATTLGTLAGLAMFVS